ncbi:MAG: thiamine pyrophosphate-requiring protein [Rhodospirillales bacterium]|jgi:acetolactate synthase-1/2/3 large subunit|nr:thiamine pyrophosphate-requiring protein [Rhodospirillales bacterium]MDP6773374.1 thiamine pyrophosphate-requiring protein [Rhodospirillales bacterium]
MPKRNLKVDSAGEAFLELLADRGVDYLFGNAGTDFASIIEGLAKAATGEARAPRPIIAPHENLAVAMAHGAYLATGRPQAVMVHVNVGTANAICGLFNAARENIPLVLAAGRTPINEDGARGARSVYIHWGQEMFDQASMVRDVVKWDYELRNPAQVEAVVDRALSVAMSEPRGPVYVSLPREVLVDGAGTVAFDSPSLRQPASAAAPDAAATRLAAQWIARARRPLVVTSSFGRNADDVPALARLAQRFALPVVGHQARYTFLPTTHPMHMGFDPKPLLGEADLIVVLDSDVPWIPELHDVDPEARVIHIGADPLFSGYPMRSFRADLALAGSSGATLGALARALAGAARVAKTKARIEARRKRLTRWRGRRDAGREKTLAAQAGEAAPTPAWVAACLNKVMGRDDVLVTEMPFALDFMDFEKPGTYFGSSSAGGLGWGLGAAIGVKLGRPERRVVGVVGDGSYMFGNPTPAHFVSQAHDLPTLTIILNNRMWAAVRNATLNIYPDGAAAKSNRAPLTYLEPAPEYQLIVEASGGYGEKVERARDLPAAIARALDAVDNEGRQAVLNVLTHQ